MYRLIELTKQNNEESQAVEAYETLEEAKDAFDAKVEEATSSGIYSGFTFIVIDKLGNVQNSKHDGEDLMPSLVEIKTTDHDIVNITRYPTEEEVFTAFSIAQNNARKETDLKAECLFGLNNIGVQVIYTYWVN